MNNMLKYIQDKIGAEHCRQSCSKDNCKVDLSDTPSPRLIVDPESREGEGLANYFPDNEKKCDSILFFQSPAGKLVVAPLEFKIGEVKATPISEKLQAAACFAERIIPKSCDSICHPILFHAGGLHKDQLKKLNRAKVRFRGARLTIQTARCGKPGNLAKALSDQREQSQTRSRRRRKVKSG